MTTLKTTYSSATSWKQGLDIPQEQAVDCNTSTLVLAGPGSGKTRVIAAKYRWVRELGKSAVAITHTRAATNEMRRRGMNASTIHALCYEGLGYPEFVTFDDLLDYEGVKQFDWVLVDEAQDLSLKQYDVITTLGNKLFLVGDSCQAIFEFGGASKDIFKFYKEDYSPKVAPLKYNYRSNQDIVRRLNRIFPTRRVISRCKNESDSSLAILTRERKEAHALSSLMASKGIAHHLHTQEHNKSILGDSNLFVGTVHCSKGLEFDRVIIRPWNREGEGERRVYYVAVSRARYDCLELGDPMRIIQEVLACR